MDDATQTTESEDRETADSGGVNGIAAAVESVAEDDDQETAPDDEEMIEVHSNGYVENRRAHDSTDAQNTAEESDSAADEKTAESDILEPERTAPSVQQSERQPRSRRDSMVTLDDAELVGAPGGPDGEEDAPEFKTRLEDFEFDRDSEPSPATDETPARGDAVFLSGEDRHTDAIAEDTKTQARQDGEQDDADDDEDEDDSSFIVGS